MQYEKLKEADEMKSEFINVAAHELRTPIQPILSLVDLIRSDMKGSHTRRIIRHYLEKCKKITTTYGQHTGCYQN